MKIYLVTFKMDDGRYDNMVDAIKKFDYWSRITETTWCVKSDINTTEKFKQAIKANCPLNDSERLFVVNITDSPWASSNIPTEVADWLKDEV